MVPLEPLGGTQQKRKNILPARINIKKAFAFFFWCILAPAALVLLVAAIRYRNNNVCKGYHGITIKEIHYRLHRYERCQRALLSTAGAGQQEKGKLIVSFDLRHRETAMLKNAIWIKDAQLFFDNNGVLQDQDRRKRTRRAHLYPRRQQLLRRQQRHPTAPADKTAGKDSPYLPAIRRQTCGFTARTAH